MATFLVTGGAGFIGSNTVHELIRRGHKVRVLDNLATGKLSNLDGVMDRIEFIKGDITSMETCRSACAGVDYVIHLAAIPSVPRSIQDPVGTNHANVTGTLTLLSAARDAGVKRVVNAASSSAYGDQEAPVKHEGLTPRPMSPYAVAKLTCEHYATVFNDIYGLQTVSLRYFNVFGPRQDPTSQYAAVIPLFVSLMLQGKRPVIYGDGEQSRDFTFVDNNVHANIIGCTAPDAAAGQTFNIACGHSVSLNQLVVMINTYLGTSIEPMYATPRAGDVRHSKADISKAARMLNFTPIVSFEAGLARTIEHLKSSTGRP